VSANSDSPKTALATGGFYVEEECWMSCGVPQSIAPELVGWRNEEQASCYWLRQPETAEEVDRAIKIIHAQELGCHRYSGNDPAILKRLPRAECDFYHPEKAFRNRYKFGPSHVGVKLSLSESGKRDGVLTRLWRRILRGWFSE
jgi:hypothetical protein